ncbi:MAG: TRAP transporter substrate-binding protein DctP [Deltaproteobacteria bacterium]|nr:TRAP transporter substrate-binding protein DctP [Deltaproteobacteria bacterium]
MMRVKAVRFSAVLGFCLVFIFASSVFAANAPKAKAAPAKKGKIVWRVATVVPGGMGWSKRAKEILLPYIDRFTGGELDVKIFWGGIKGDDDAILRQVKRGELEGGGFSGYGTVAACREFSVLTLPFLFKNFDEVDFIRKSMYPEFDRHAENRGMKLLLWVDQDFDQIYSMKHDLTSLAKIRASHFVRWYGDIEKHLFTTLGVKSTPASITDINRIIGKGEVDAAIAPAMWVLGSQIFPFVKYILPVKVRYSPVTVMISKKVWNAAPEQYRIDYMKEREAITREFNDYSRKDSERCMRAMIAYGIVEVKIDQKEGAQLQAMAKTVWKRAAGDLYPQSLLDEVIAKLEQYRKAKG